LSSGDSKGRIIGPVSRVLKAALLSPFVNQNLRTLSVQRSGDDLRYLGELIEAGKVTPVIDKTYPLSEAPDAIRYLETGHARGKVVIAI
jgi:NADPH:quinone reductase-like Zn-dependent oxidoreductase